MTRKTINEFMWGFQPHFRLHVKHTMIAVLKSLGYENDIEVYVIGFRVEEGSNPICVESADGSIVSSQLQDVRNRGSVLYKEHPRSQLFYGDARLHEIRHNQLRDACRAEALKEAIEHHYPTGDFSFFVSQSTRIGAYEVHVAVGVTTDLLMNTPKLVTREKDYFPVTSSLVSSAIREVLDEATKALHGPEPGSASRIERTDAEMVRSAAQQFVQSIVMLASDPMPTPFYEALNEISTMRYERREGVGHLLLARRDATGVARKFTLSSSVNLRQHRAFRKLLEISGAKGLALLTDGEEIYGLGSLEDSYDPASESVFSIKIIGPGTWEIYHGDLGLLRVQYKRPMLPGSRLDPKLFADIVVRVFKQAEARDVATLWDLAQAAIYAEHGTMLVVSADAAGEARRLSAQAIVINAAPITANDLDSLTSIDGAVLVDPRGMMHAIGVILDGVATESGDPSRGSRYNSAVRYLAGNKIATLILVVSEDGMVNVLPDLPRRISRRELQNLISNLHDEAKKAGDESFNIEKFNKYYDHLKSLSFYLSHEQCNVINELRQNVDDRLWDANNLRVIYEKLQPHPEMNDSYFLDEL